jgi:hypothetical protein
MKAILAPVLALLVTVPAFADKRSDAYNACLQETRQLVGDEARVDLRKMRNSMGAVLVALNVKPQGADRQTLKCRYEKGVATVENESGLQLGKSSPAMAAADSAG